MQKYGVIFIEVEIKKNMKIRQILSETKQNILICSFNRSSKTNESNPKPQGLIPS